MSLPIVYGLDLSATPPVCWREPARGTAKAVAWPPDEAARLELGKGTAVLAIAAPARATVVRRLEAPFASARKADRVWPSLLDMDLPFPVEAAQCDYAPLPPADGKARALACAVRRADLEPFLDGVAASGASPAFCDAEAPALWSEHLRDAPPSGADRPRLLVHAAADHVTVLRGRGRELETVHVLRAAPSALPAAQWRARFRQIASGGDAPADVWWSGSADAEALRGALSGDPGLRHETHRDPVTFLARALARRVADGQCAALLPPDRLPSAIVRRRQRGLRSVWLAAAAVSLLVLALNAALRIRHGAERGRLEAQLAQTASEIVADGPLVPGQEVLLARRALADGAPAREAIRLARLPSPHPEQALGLLNELAGRGARFSRVAWTSAGIEIAGTAPSPRAVENLSGGWSPNVSVQPGTDGCVFRLKGGWPGEP